MFHTLLITLLLSLSTLAAAIPRYERDEYDTRPLMDQPYEYLVTSDDLTLEQAMARTDWRLEKNTGLPLAGPWQSLWVRYEVTNRTDDLSWAIVAFRDPNIDEASFYILRASGQVDDAHFQTRVHTFHHWAEPLPGRYFDFKPNETITVVIKQRGLLGASHQFHITPHHLLDRFMARYQQFMGFYLGIATLATIMGLMFLLAFRERFYLAYAVYCFSFGFLGFVNTGLANYWICHHLAVPPSMLQKIMEVLPVIPGLWMGTLFLNTPERLPRADALIRRVMLAAVILLVVRTLFLIPTPWDQALVTTLHLTTFGTLMTCCAILGRHGDRGAQLFFLAWTALCVSVLAWGNGKMGALPNTFWLLYSPYIGQAFEVMILMLATFFRINDLYEAKLETAQAKATSSSLKVMLRALSHDLSNPLTMITILASRNAKLEAAEKPVSPGGWAKILRACEQQKSIIEHVRLMRSLEDNKAKLILAPVALAHVCEELHTLFDERLKAKGQRLTIDLSAAREAHVLAERSSLTHQVLANILSNAIKFTPEGNEIRLQAGVNSAYVWVEIIDQGIGIPAERLAQLFSFGETTTSAGTNGEKGTGFGMPLVKTYMDRFGGIIHVESRVGAGTTIRLEFRAA